jgi:DNA-binding LacI/PurR family transcriptional regulator
MSEAARRPSLTSLAEEAGVSKTTVHRVLAGNGSVGEDMRTRVLQAADDLGYRPNLLARALRTERTGMVAVVMRWAHGELTAPFNNVLEGQMELQGRFLVTACTNTLPERERALVEFFAGIGADGLVIEPEPVPENLEFYADLARQVPLVLIQDSAPDVSVSANIVCVQNEEVGYCATRHLLDCGRSRVAIIPLPDTAPNSWWMWRRQEGCERALREAGAPPPTILPIYRDPAEEPNLYHERNGYEYAVGPVCSERAVCEFFSQGGEADAIFAMNDLMAFGALRGLAKLGLRVPEDVAVIGVDDRPHCRTSHPPLTSVRLPLERVATEVAELLTNMLESGPQTPVHRFLSPQLVVRASTMGQPAVSYVGLASEGSSLER